MVRNYESAGHSDSRSVSATGGRSPVPSSQERLVEDGHGIPGKELPLLASHDEVVCPNAEVEGPTSHSAQHKSPAAYVIKPSGTPGSCNTSGRPMITQVIIWALCPRAV